MLSEVDYALNVGRALGVDFSLDVDQASKRWTTLKRNLSLTGASKRICARDQSLFNLAVCLNFHHFRLPQLGEFCQFEGVLGRYDGCISSVCVSISVRP